MTNETKDYGVSGKILKRIGACADHRLFFVDELDNGDEAFQVPITEENINKASRLRLDLRWVLMNSFDKFNKSISRIQRLNMVKLVLRPDAGVLKIFKDKGGPGPDDVSIGIMMNHLYVDGFLIWYGINHCPRTPITRNDLYYYINEIADDELANLSGHSDPANPGWGSNDLSKKMQRAYHEFYRLIWIALLRNHGPEYFFKVLMNPRSMDRDQGLEFFNNLGIIMKEMIGFNFAEMEAKRNEGLSDERTDTEYGYIHLTEYGLEASYSWINDRWISGENNSLRAKAMDVIRNMTRYSPLFKAPAIESVTEENSN
jgi:hypothetical protein